MKTADAKERAFDIFSQLPDVDVSESTFKKNRLRGKESLGAYYGSWYFNPCQIQGNDPELQLTAKAVRGTVRWRTDGFSVFVLTYEELFVLTKKKSSYFMNWSFYSFVQIDDLVIVFPQNRPNFGRALAAVTGGKVSSCQGFRDGSFLATASFFAE